MNMIKIILLLGIMMIIVGAFVGFICLQVHISKNNKRGKFTIPIVMFLLPFIMGLILVVISFVPYNTRTESGYEEVETNYVYNEDDELVIQEEVSEDGDFGVATAGIVITVVYVSIVMGWPTAIVTLIIELVYRSKRKQITDEEVIDIQNL